VGMTGLLRAVLVAAITILAAGVAVAATYPAHIDLPDGYEPEGIASGKGHTLFVGSIPTGEVRRIDARTGEQEVVVAGAAGRQAIGLKADEKRRLFVAGGPTGKAFVYSAKTGDELAQFQLTTSATAFINDVVVTRKGAYFTDSSDDVIYKVARDLSGFEAIQLDGFTLSGQFNLNGIEAAKGGKVLLAVQSEAGVLWRIDPSTGDAEAVDLGADTLASGDGLLLLGKRTLFVVQNFQNKIAVVRLSKDLRSGTIKREITSDDFDIPTTVARIGKRLYLPNARFTTPATPDTAYWVTKVHR
jgi:hypothetical protein